MNTSQARHDQQVDFIINTLLDRNLSVYWCSSRKFHIAYKIPNSGFLRPICNNSIAIDGVTDIDTRHPYDDSFCRNCINKVMVNPGKFGFYIVNPVALDRDDNILSRYDKLKPSDTIVGDKHPIRVSRPELLIHMGAKDV